jgi:hypothetical protein
MKRKKEKQKFTYWLCGPLRTLTSVTTVHNLLYYLSPTSTSSLSAHVCHSLHLLCISIFLLPSNYFKTELKKQREWEKN